MERAGAAVAGELISGIPRRSGSRSSVAAGRTAATGGSRCGCCGRPDAKRRRRTTSRARTSSSTRSSGRGSAASRARRPRPDRTDQRGGAPVVAVDVPPGSTRRRERSPARRCGPRTVTFGGPKVGLYVAPGRSIQARSSSPNRAGGGRDRAPARQHKILELVPLRGPADTKYTAGSVLVVGGAPGPDRRCLPRRRGGVPSGRGLGRGLGARGLAAGRRDAAARGGQDQLGRVDDILPKARAVALGPGIGRSDEARGLLARLLREVEVPVVLDADALFGLEPGDWRPPVVLTPHAGELGRLLGESSEWVDAHRLEAVVGAAERFGCVCLLKGSDTLVAAPGEGVLVRPRRPRPRDGRHRRRPDRRGRLVPRQGARAAARSSGRQRPTGSRPRGRRTRPAWSQATSSPRCPSPSEGRPLPVLGGPAAGVDSLNGGPGKDVASAALGSTRSSTARPGSRSRSTLLSTGGSTWLTTVLHRTSVVRSRGGRLV